MRREITMFSGNSFTFVFSATNNHSRLNRTAITAGEFDWSGEKRRTIHDEEKAEKTEHFQSHSIIPRVNAPQARVRESQSRKKSNAKTRPHRYAKRCGRGAKGR